MAENAYNYPTHQLDAHIKAVQQVWNAIREFQELHVEANPNDIDAAKTILPEWQKAEVLKAISVTMEHMGKTIDEYWERTDGYN